MNQAAIQPPATGALTLYRVTLDWNSNNDEEGTYCNTVWASDHDDAIRQLATEMADTDGHEYDTPADREKFIAALISGAGPYAAEDCAAMIDSDLSELLASRPRALATIRELIKNALSEIALASVPAAGTPR